MKGTSVYVAICALAILPALVHADALPCSTTEAFGQKFGSSAVKAAAGVASERNVLAKGWGEPFQPQLVDITVKSREVFAVMGTAAFADAGAALEYAEKLIEGFRVDLPAADVEVKAPGIAVLYSDKTGFTEKLGGRDVFFHTAGVKVDIEVAGKVVHVSCSDLSVHAKHIKEAMAK